MRAPDKKIISRFLQVLTTYLIWAYACLQQRNSIDQSLFYSVIRSLLMLGIFQLLTELASSGVTYQEWTGRERERENNIIFNFFRPAVPLPGDRLSLQQCLEPNCFRHAQVYLIKLITWGMTLSLVYQTAYDHDQDEFNQADKESNIPSPRGQWRNVWCDGRGRGRGGRPLVHRNGEVRIKVFPEKVEVMMHA